MSRERKARPAAIGLFVLGAAALALTAVVVFGSGRFFRRQVEAVCYFSGSVNGLNAGAPVKFRGVPIGRVSEIRFRVPPPALASPAELRIPVWLAIDETTLSELTGDTVALTRERLDRLIAAGLRAQLQTESFVTGVLYVGVDYFPDSPAILVQAGDETVLEIPTLPTTLEQAFEAFTKVMARVDKLDIEGLVSSLRETVEGVGELARSPEVGRTLEALRATLVTLDQLGQSLRPGLAPAVQDVRTTTGEMRTVLVRLNETIARLGMLLDPQAPLAVEASRTLAELGAAARSVASLADFLDRHPNAILTGRPGP